MKEMKFNVTGMSCSACSSRVEKVVRDLEGVREVSVNLLTGTMKVAFDEKLLETEDIENAVEAAGYGASPAGEKKTDVPRRIQKAATVENMRRRLIASGVLLVLLIAVSLAADKNTPMTTALIQMLLLTPIVLFNKKFFVKGIPGMFRGSFNMDTLVALGAGTSILYGLFSVFKMAEGFETGNMMLIKMYYRPMYFQSAGTILTLISIGKYLETKSKGKTSEAIRALVSLAPDTATIEKDGREIKVAAADLKKGDIMLVRPGERFAADGTIIEGQTNADESAITGESMPVEKHTGDSVVSATINKTGFIKVRCDKTGEDTTLSQIIELVEEASSSKAPIARLADRIAGVFVPTVICVALLTTIVWLIMGKTFSFALFMGITVFVISCPCALGLATPVAIMVGTGKGAEQGVLIKSGEAFQLASEIDTIVLDKTGTVTTGHPAVTDVILYDGGRKVSERTYAAKALPENDLKEFLSNVSALERGSEHPLAEAVLDFAKRLPLSDRKATGFKALPGSGVTAVIDGILWGAGNRDLAKKTCQNTSFMEEDYSRLAGEGKTPLIIAEDGKIRGLIAVADQAKESSREAIAKFKEMGIDVLMLTGDNAKTAEAVGKRVGIEKVIANVYPGDKEMVVRKLKEEGHKVAMVGDGINDAPALVRADVGIAIGAGTDVAIESADIVLMHSDLLDAVTAVKLSKAVLRNIKQNLGWAFGYNTILIPLASGVFFPVFGVKLNPMIGALMMSLSSFIVVSNALRLRFFKGERKASGKTASSNRGPKDEKTYTFHVSGMMCGKCEAHVEEALKDLSGITDAKADHKEGTVTVKAESSVKEEDMKAAITEAGYEVAEAQQEYVLNVSGMQCGKCEAHAEEEIRKLPGVKSVKADCHKNSVKVTATKKLSEDEMAEAIRKAGYTVMGNGEKVKETVQHVLKVSGMMCEKCEAHVEKGLKEVEGVIEAKADHVKHEVQVTTKLGVQKAEMEKAVIAAGYEMEPEKTMEYVIDVSGMMCPKCEMHVIKDVEKIPGVVLCKASHKEGKVVVKANRPGLLDAIEKVITEAGYEVENK